MRASPRLDPFKKTIDEWLLGDLEAPPKQRHTVQRILNRLRLECGAEIAYTTEAQKYSLHTEVIPDGWAP